MFVMLSAVLLLVSTLIQSQGVRDSATAIVEGSPPESSDSDTLAVSAVFKATGGVVTDRGAFTAGAKPGNFRVIAASAGLADTSKVVVAVTARTSPPTTAPAAAPRTAATAGGTGIQFGPFGGWGGSQPRPHTEPFTLVIGSDRANNIIGRIRQARSRNLRMVTNMTGGAHSNYKTDGVFNVLKWEARTNAYNTPAIRAAVAEGVADGTIIGNIIMDEPANTSPQNSWGPAGTMNKARLDSMAAYAKSIFPTLPMGVTLDYRIWNDQSFRIVDFQVSQYRLSKGDVTRYRDGALALGVRDGHAILFSMNILDGGKPGSNCPIPETGGPGTFPPNCRMTSDQVLEFGQTLGPVGCAFLMWRHDPDFMADSENRRAFELLGKELALRPRKACSRG